MQITLKKHALFLLLILISVLISYPDWLGSGVPAVDDLSRLNIPQRMFLAWAYRHGQLPLWNPFSFAGQPLLAAGQSGPLYLPNLVFIMFPIVKAVKLSYLCHELIVAYSMYVLVYSVGHGRLGAFVSSVSFTTCGFLLGHQIHTQMFDAICWLPLITYAFLKLLQRITLRHIVLFAVVFAGEIYAGHPQITFYIVFYLGLLGIFQFLHERTWVMIKRLSGVGVAGILGLGLSALQWLPTLDFVTYSDRAMAGSQFLLFGSMPGQGLQQFLTPFTAGGGYTGHPFSINTYDTIYHSVLFWEFTCYAGLIVLVCAGVQVIHAWRTSAIVKSLTASLLITTLLALGANTFLSWVLVHVPGFDLFRVPSRYIGLSDFTIAILGGLGVNSLLNQNGTVRVRFIFAVVFACVGFTLCVLVSFGTIPSAPARAYLIPILVCVVLALWSLVPFQSARRLLASTTAMLAVVDCLVTANSLSTFIVKPSANYLTPSKSTLYLQQHLGFASPFTRVLAAPDTTLSHDASAAYEIPSVDGYDSLEPTWYANRVGVTWKMDTLKAQPRSLLDNLNVRYLVTAGDSGWPPVVSAPTQDWTMSFASLPAHTTSLKVSLVPPDVYNGASDPMLSVTIVNGSHTISVIIYNWQSTSYVIQLPASWPQNGQTKIYLQNESWDETFQVESVAWLRNDMQPLLSVPIYKTFGPKAWIPVETGGGETVWENPDPTDAAWMISDPHAVNMKQDGTIKLSSWGVNRSNWHVVSGAPGWMVVSQMFDPGWKAEIDGKPASIQPINDVLTGIWISKAGSHNVNLTYQPASFCIGLIITAATAAFMLCGLLWLRLRKRRE